MINLVSFAGEGWIALDAETGSYISKGADYDSMLDFMVLNPDHEFYAAVPEIQFDLFAKFLEMQKGDANV